VRLKALLYKGLLLPAVCFAGGAAFTVLKDASAGPSRDTPYAVVAQLGRVLVEVENEYVEPVDRARLVNGAIKGMVAELDPHSAYLPPQDFTLFQSETEGKFGGVGIEVDARHDQLTVIAPIEGSPAERAGVKSGDRIVAVDGVDVTGQGLDRVVRKMRGDPGTRVKLTVRRPGKAEPITFELVREIVKVPSVTSKMLDGGIGYLRIKQFQERCHDELVQHAGRLRSEGKLSGLLLDMRANPGGLVDEAANIADEFLDSGTIYTTRHRGQVIDDVKARKGGAFNDIPIVILVSEYSASASELVAGALQDHKRAIVVGAHTFGKGSVQAILSLPSGAGLRLTIARYYTPSGRSIQADGVHPDIVIDSPRLAGANVVRERDLEGHLPAEGPHSPPQPDAKDAGAPAAPAGDGGTDGITTDVRSMPSDPTKGTDVVLRMAYQVMKASLAGKGPLIR
jgi:carboxyl-terminal processing protease